jgi:hypothetical protein
MAVDPLNLVPLGETAARRRRDASVAAQQARQRALTELAGRAALTGDAGYAEPNAAQRIIGRAAILDDLAGGYGDAAAAWWDAQPGIATGLLVGLGDAGAAAYEKAKKNRGRRGVRRGGGRVVQRDDSGDDISDLQLYNMWLIEQMRNASIGVPTYTGRRSGSGLVKVS